MKLKEEDVKSLYYFLLDTDQLPSQFKGSWEKDKVKFKTYIKKNDDIKDIYY